MDPGILFSGHAKQRILKDLVPNVLSDDHPGISGCSRSAEPLSQTISDTFYFFALIIFGNSFRKFSFF